MLFIAYTFKGQVHVFAGRVKIVSHTSCRTSTILKYFCPLDIKFYRLHIPTEIDFHDPTDPKKIVHLIRFQNKVANVCSCSDFQSLLKSSLSI